jgi:hypothetical protein
MLRTNMLQFKPQPAQMPVTPLAIDWLPPLRSEWRYQVQLASIQTFAAIINTDLIILLTRMFNIMIKFILSLKTKRSS